MRGMVAMAVMLGSVWVIAGGGGERATCWPVQRNKETLAGASWRSRDRALLLFLIPSSDEETWATGWRQDSDEPDEVKEKVRAAAAPCLSTCLSFSHDEMNVLTV